MERAREALQVYFDGEDFRPGQAEVISAILKGRDVLGVMPAGSGKRFCCQVAAMALEGTTMIITPRIEQMKQWVMELQQRGIPADYFYDEMGAYRKQQFFQNVGAGRYRIIYVTPERMRSGELLYRFRWIRVPLVAVLEANRISPQGQDYLQIFQQITEFLKRMYRRPTVAAFSDGASEFVRQDILQRLEMQDPLQVSDGFCLPNLYFAVHRPVNKSKALLALLAERSGKKGVIYCATPRDAERLCVFLGEYGIAAVNGAAQQTEGERQDSRGQLSCDGPGILVTVSGLDTAVARNDAAYVIHYNIPASLEIYYREAVGALQYGSEAECIALYAPPDVCTARFLVLKSRESEEMTAELRRQVYRGDQQRLDTMVDYSTSSTCLRCFIRAHFGQKTTEQCGDCSNCLTTRREQDITDEARKLISTYRRLRRQAGCSLGPTVFKQILLGINGRWTRDQGLDKSPFFGLMKKTAPSRLSEQVEALIQNDLFDVDQSGCISLTARCGRVLFDGERVTVQISELRPRQQP